MLELPDHSGTHGQARWHATSFVQTGERRVETETRAVQAVSRLLRVLLATWPADRPRPALRRLPRTGNTAHPPDSRLRVRYSYCHYYIRPMCSRKEPKHLFHIGRNAYPGDLGTLCGTRRPQPPNTSAPTCIPAGIGG